MKRSSFLAIAVFGMATMAMSAVADAARMGGGRSLGAQRPSVAPRMATPPASAPSAAASQPVMPAQPGATLPARSAVPAAAAPSGASRWLGPIAGIAAGLGLAALLSHFGLPEGLGSFLLIALLVIGGVFVLRWLFMRRAQTQRPFAYAGPANPTTAPPPFGMPKAQDWDGAARIEPALGTASAAPTLGSPLPPGFDAEGFVRNAKQQFVRLQAAHDAGNRKVLAEVLTPEMLAEVTRDFDTGGTRAPSEVLTLNGEVLEVATEGDHHWASVRFTGTMRESDSTAPVAFDEVWNLTKPTDDSGGWLLAGIQQPT